MPRKRQLKALLRALHTEVDAADEAGEDDWVWTGTGMSCWSDMEYENGFGFLLPKTLSGGIREGYLVTLLKKYFSCFPDLVKDDAKVDPFLRTQMEHIKTSLPDIWNIPPVPEPAVEMPQPAAALMHVRTPISGLRRTRHPVTPTSHVSSVASSSINSLELWSRSSDAG